MSVYQGSEFGRPRASFAEKLWSVNWGLVLLLTVIACVGFAMLYSAANGHWQPWAGKQAIRYGIAVVIMLGVAMVDIRFWLKAAYYFYGIAFALLIFVMVHGRLGMGAQRWIDLGIIQLQPSELMKIASLLVLARWFNGIAPEDIGRPHLLIWPTLLVLAPAALVLKQPDLGTAFMQGSQAHLSFLPEKQTDFIFTMLAEEWGLMGGLVLLALYTLVFIYGYAIAFRCRNQFGRLLALGITVNFFLYAFINIAMVMGLIPVVGVPLPLISYGGTAMLTVMSGFGLLMSVYVHRDTRIGRFGESES